ncbi:MAG: MCE family protein [Candidatus Glassbacteria bacterium]|nr:MCE family protein [Candidatus Glassbacteria bacterium]
MPNIRTSTTIVGIAIFLAMVIVLWIIFYLQGYITQRNTVIYSASFENVGMLEVGDNVSVAGVPVGRVQTIELAGVKAEVSFSVIRRVKITGDTEAIVQTGDLFGESYLQLLIGLGPPLAPGGKIAGRLAPGLQDVMSRSLHTVDQVNQVLSKASGLITELERLVGPGSPLPQTLENIESITGNARTFSERFEDYDLLLRRVLVSIDSAAGSIQALVDTNAAGVQGAVSHLEVLSARLDTLTNGLQAGRGTLGRLMRDERLYQDLEDTIREARNLIAEVREHPEKFIRVKVF